MIEVNVITPLNEDYGIHGGYIKVIGTSFRNSASSFPRHVTIRGFFERVTSKSTYSSNLINLCRDINVESIREIKSIQEDINQYVKVQRELTNRYDTNAIAVYVNTSSLFTKVGFLPKDLAELIVTNEFKYYVVGFEKSGKGILLTMIFNSPEISFIALNSKVEEPKKSEKIGYIKAELAGILSEFWSYYKFISTIKEIRTGNGQRSWGISLEIRKFRRNKKKMSKRRR